MTIYALPQPLNGEELCTITQIQNGNPVECSMTISQFISFVNQSLFSNLPTTLPTAPGVIWNNNGVISRS